MTPAGLPHSDTPGSQLGCQLPRAYRRLQRPSSALDAKASTVCPSQLVSQTLNKNHTRHTPHHQHQPPTPTQPHNGVEQGDRQPPPAAGKISYKRSDNHPENLSERLPDARVHYPHVKHPTHQPPPAHTQQTTRERRHRTTNPTPTTRHHSQQPTANSHGPDQRGKQTGLIPQGPTACQNPTPPTTTQVPHPRTRAKARPGRRY
jgi:hypothetical protein